MLKDGVVPSIFKHKETKKPKRKSPRKHVSKEGSQKESPFSSSSSSEVTDEEVILDSNNEFMDLGRDKLLGESNS